MSDHPAQRHWRPGCRCGMQPCINLTLTDADRAVLDAARAWAKGSRGKAASLGLNRDTDAFPTEVLLADAVDRWEANQ